MLNKNVNVLDKKMLEFKYSGPKTIPTVRVQNCEEVFKEYLTTADITQISIRRVVQAVKYNLETLQKVIQQIITQKNVQMLKQRLLILRRGESFNISDQIVKCQQKEIFKQIMSSFDEIDIEILEKVQYNEWSIKALNSVAQLNIDSDLYHRITQTKVDPGKIQSLTTLAHYKIDSETLNDHLKNMLSNLLAKQQYSQIELIFEECKSLKNYIIILQDILKTLIQDQKLIYISCKDRNESFVQNNIIPKLGTNNYYHECILKMAAEEWLRTGRLQKSNEESLITLQVQNNILIASNHFWNQGQINLTQLQTKDKSVLQALKEIKLEQHKIHTLISVIYTIKYENITIYLTETEYEEILKFKNLKSKAQNIDLVKLQRLSMLGVVVQEKGELILQKLELLTNFQFIYCPQEKKVVDIEITAQEKKIIIETHVAKIMKAERTIKLEDLRKKLMANQLIRRLLKFVNETEVEEAIKSLISKDVVLQQNNQLYYNI